MDPVVDIINIILGMCSKENYNNFRLQQFQVIVVFCVIFV